MARGEATGGRGGGDLLRISRAQFWVAYAVAVALFFFDTGPIWRHPWDIGALDRAILWSYAPIPFLVAGCLLGSRRFSLHALFLDTLELTMLKYATTLGIALVLFEITPVPQVAPPPRPARGVVAEPALVPTPIDPATTGSVSGTVLSDGRAIAGGVDKPESDERGPAARSEVPAGIPSLLLTAFAGCRREWWDNAVSGKRRRRRLSVRRRRLRGRFVV
jgi:hypothetical protein